MYGSAASVTMKPADAPFVYALNGHVAPSQGYVVTCNISQAASRVPLGHADRRFCDDAWCPVLFSVLVLLLADQSTQAKVRQRSHTCGRACMRISPSP